MAIKNIEMSVYNGSSYDTLLPVTSSENVTIASAISGLFGLGADSTLTDILQKLSNAVIWDGSSTELPNGSSIVTGARIETGSYVGTGTYGASNPCSLTFDNMPLMIIIASFAEGLYDTANTSFGFLTNTISGNAPSGIITHVDKNSLSNNDTSLSLMISTTTNIFHWYTLGSNATWQLNESSRRYSYITFY